MPINDRDPFARRTASPSTLAPWLLDLVTNLGGLWDSYRPARTIDAVTRERVAMAVTEVNGCRFCAWIHGSWQDYLGDPDGAQVDPDDALLVFARACAEIGHPLDPAGLDGRIDPAALPAIRATIAQIEVSNLVGNTVDGLLARLTRKRPLDPLAAATELATIGIALPIAVPLLALAAGMRTIHRLAPDLPPISMPSAGEANLLVHLLAAAAPRLLGNPVVRTAVLRLPGPFALGLQAGRTQATVRVGQGTLSLENGIADDVDLVVEGDVDALLRAATGEIGAELARLRPRLP